MYSLRARLLPVVVRENLSFHDDCGASCRGHWGYALRLVGRLVHPSPCFPAICLRRGMLELLSSAANVRAEQNSVNDCHSWPVEYLYRVASIVFLLAYIPSHSRTTHHRPRLLHKLARLIKTTQCQEQCPKPSHSTSGHARLFNKGSYNARLVPQRTYYRQPKVIIPHFRTAGADLGH